MREKSPYRGDVVLFSRGGSDDRAPERDAVSPGCRLGHQTGHDPGTACRGQPQCSGGQAERAAVNRDRDLLAARIVDRHQQAVAGPQEAEDRASLVPGEDLAPLNVARPVDCRTGESATMSSLTTDPTTRPRVESQ